MCQTPPHIAEADIGNRFAAYAVVTFLRHDEPALFLARFGQTEPIPKKKVQTVKFRGMIPYAEVTAPRQEGVTPSVSETSFEDVTITLQQWGDVPDLNGGF